MWKEEDEYYDNIQDIENLIQREMQELNKMQEVVKQKRSTLNDMGVKIDTAKMGEEDLGLLEVLNDKGTQKEQGLKSPLRVAPRDSSREGGLKGVETGGAFSQGMNYRFGRPKTPDLLLKNQAGGVNFLGKNKEQINQISQKNKLEKEERERSQSKKPAAATKYESVTSKIKEKTAAKSSQKLERASVSPKPAIKIEAKHQKVVAETHTFEEEAEPAEQTSKLEAKSSARSISRTKAKKDEVPAAQNPPAKPKPAAPQVAAKPTMAPAPKPTSARAKAAPEPAPVPAAPPKQTTGVPAKKPFRPDTMDLFSKLEEYTRYKENMDLLNHAEEIAAEGAVIEKKPKAEKENVAPEKTGKQQLKKGEDAGEFLRKKITDFGKKEEKSRPLPVPPANNSYSSRVLKERSPSAKNMGSSRATAANQDGDLSPKRSARNYSSKLQAGLQASPLQQKTPRGATPQKSHLARSIDLKKVVEPRFRREKVELPAEPSFQPMLSRKSLILAEKMGYNGESLWNSRTPTKQQQGHRSGSREHNSHEQGMKEGTSSPWMSRMAGGADHPNQNNNHYSQGAPSFQPKICEKSKQIDQYKYRGQGPRFEVLHQLGAEQHLRLERRMRDKAKEEEAEIKAMSFQPRTGHLEGEGMYKSGVGIADRNEQWAQRKEERIQRLKESQMRAEAEQCSFKPKLVVGV